MEKPDIWCDEDYGQVEIRIEEVLRRAGISKNRLRTLRLCSAASSTHTVKGRSSGSIWPSWRGCAARSAAPPGSCFDTGNRKGRETGKNNWDTPLTKVPMSDILKMRTYIRALGWGFW